MSRLVAVKMERKERLGCIFSQQNLPMGCFDLSSEKKVWALSNCVDGVVIFCNKEDLGETGYMEDTKFWFGPYYF